MNGLQSELLRKGESWNRSESFR